YSGATDDIRHRAAYCTVLAQQLIDNFLVHQSVDDAVGAIDLCQQVAHRFQQGFGQAVVLYQAADDAIWRQCATQYGIFIQQSSCQTIFSQQSTDNTDLRAQATEQTFCRITAFFRCCERGNAI